MSQSSALPRRVALLTLASLALLGLVVAAALATGVEHVDLRLAFTDPSSVDAAILFGTRLTRVLLGALVGMALAPAGVAFQALLRNPLADPYVLGISGGAAVCALAVIMTGALAWVGPAAFAGALASTLIVFTLARTGPERMPWTPTRLLLTGGTGFVGSWLLDTLLHANRRMGLDARVVVPEPVAFVPSPAPVELTPEPAPAPVVEPLAAAEPVRVPELDELFAPKRATDFRVVVRLKDAEGVEVGSFRDFGTAMEGAQEVIEQFSSATDGQWPFYAGRFIRPDLIVSVDVVEGGDEL